MRMTTTLPLLLLIWLAAVSAALGQPKIKVIAGGNPGVAGDGITAIGATVTASTITVDPAGDIYIWEDLN